MGDPGILDPSRFSAQIRKVEARLGKLEVRPKKKGPHLILVGILGKLSQIRKVHQALSDGVFKFQEVDTETILSIIRSLKNQNSSGVNNISNILLKEIAPYIIKPLYKLLNRSIKTGTVPKSFKKAKVIPVYK